MNHNIKEHLIIIFTFNLYTLFKLGKRIIKLKKTTPKNLLARGEISSLVIQALREIGKGKLTESEKGIILNLLKKENEKDLIHDIQLAPVWIQKIMKQARKDG